MTLPSVVVRELDGQLGIQPPGLGNILALVGNCDSGTVATPSTYTRVKDLVADRGGGPLVEAAAYAIERYGQPVVVCAVDAGATGTFGSIDNDLDGGSTATPALDTGTFPNDDYEAEIVFTTDVVLGTSGKYKFSLDGGKTFSPVQNLGTSLSITLPFTGGASVILGTSSQTLTAGDTITFRCFAPALDSTKLGDALQALQDTRLPWETCEVVGDLDSTLAGVVSTKITAMHNAGKHRWAMGHFRMPDDGESDSTYQTAFDTEFASFADTSVSIAAGRERLLSSISFRQYHRPPSFGAAPMNANVSEEIDIAAIDLGPVPGASIRDSNGNVEDHDESITPGLDDLRALSLRSFEGLIGVFVTNPRLMSPVGSDFVFIPYRRVMNIARTQLGQYFLRRLSKPIRVDRKTGFILEEEARDIESGANAVLRNSLLAKPKASDATFVLSRNDNILSTFTLTGEARIIPLAYPKSIIVEVGFNNPALRIVQV